MSPPCVGWTELGDPYRANIVDREGTLGLDLGVYGAPETYLVDAAGVVRYRHVGVVDERVWQTILQPLYQQLVQKELADDNARDVPDVAAVGARQCMAVIETYEFSDPELEQRYQQLSQELRCPKCQNQNIADSNAPISQDLRKLLYQQLEAGADDEEILEYMVARYGEFVRYRPRFERR